MTRSAFGLLAAIGVAAAAGPASVRAQEPVSFAAADGGRVYGYWYRTSQPVRALILAFHQGGASGRAEYGPIAPRLNDAGYDVLTIDQRAGGRLFGGENRAVNERGEESGYCDAVPDLAGTLAYARAERPNTPIVLWGSSYSGALTLRLASTNPDGVIGVLAFSPASGGPMADCRGEEVSARIDVPVLALRPAGEMEREASRRQFAQFRDQGHQTHVADPGEHGSSMLVADRVGGSVDATWKVVLHFLRELTPR